MASAIRLLFWITMYVYFTSNCSNGERGTPISTKANLIDSMFKEIQIRCGLGEGASPGFALAVVHGDTLFARGYGVADLNQATPVTEKTIFGIGPITKTFTATLLTKLLFDHPKFSLETPIAEMLKPRFKFHDGMRTAKANSVDLLGMRMGLVPHNYMALQDFLTRKRLQFKMRHMKRASKFRGSSINSDIMYSLAASVTETLGNATWEDLVSKHFLSPLKMTSSTFFSRLQSGKHTATAYTHDSGKLRELTDVYLRAATKLGGAQSMVSSAADMGRWMRFLLSEGRIRRRTVLSQAVLNATHTAVQGRRRPMQRPPINKKWSEKGPALGWITGLYRDREVLWSTRSGRSLATGYLPWISLFPAEHLGVFTVFTGDLIDERGQSALHGLIADVLMNTSSRLNISSVCSKPARWIKPDNLFRSPEVVSSLPGAERSSKHPLAGVYYNSIYGRIVVFESSSEDRLEMHYGPVKSLLTPLPKKNRFKAEGTGDFWLFRVTCRFQSTSKKGIRLKIPEFVPNYPKSPIVFIRSNTEIPDAFLSTTNTAPVSYGQWTDVSDNMATRSLPEILIQSSTLTARTTLTPITPLGVSTSATNPITTTQMVTNDTSLTTKMFRNISRRGTTVTSQNDTTRTTPFPTNSHLSTETVSRIPSKTDISGTVVPWSTSANYFASAKSSSTLLTQESDHALSMTGSSEIYMSSVDTTNGTPKKSFETVTSVVINTEGISESTLATASMEPSTAPKDSREVTSDTTFEAIAKIDITRPPSSKTKSKKISKPNSTDSHELSGETTSKTITQITITPIPSSETKSKKTSNPTSLDSLDVTSDKTLETITQNDITSPRNSKKKSIKTSEPSFTDSQDVTSDTTFTTTTQSVVTPPPTSNTNSKKNSETGSEDNATLDKNDPSSAASSVYNCGFVTISCLVLSFVFRKKNLLRIEDVFQAINA